MTESYKNKSRLITVFAFIITILSTITVEQYQTILGKYSYLAPIIVTIIAFIMNQLSEEKRVNNAEQIIKEKTQITTGYPLQKEQQESEETVGVDTDDTA